MTTLIVESDTVITKKSSVKKEDASFTSIANDEYGYYDIPKEENTMKTDNNSASPLSMSSASSDEDESTSYFEKPLRTFSEETIMTPLIDTPDEKPKGPILEQVVEEDQIITISEENSEELKDVSLKEEHTPIKIITSSLASGKRPDIHPIPVNSRISPTHPEKDILYEPCSSPVEYHRQSIDNESIASTASTARSIFALWSPFKTSSSTSTSLSSKRTSKQNASNHNTPRPSAAYAARQRSLDKPQSIISPLPGFQETLLAQMEQLNLENTYDPKSKVLKNLKRQSIRQNLVSQNKGDDYDWDFWAGIMCDYQNLSKINKDLIQHIRFGIPPSVRGMVWQLLAKSKSESLVAKYIELLRVPSPYDKMIQRDLARTFPGHNYFKETDGQGQEGLYNVVRAYSVYDDKVGYCQGLAFIVGPMLLNMPDEDAFCLLIQLMSKYGLRGHFTPDMDGLQLRLYQFDALVKEYLPHVARHLKEQGISSTMYASQWFMTLFAYKFPLHLVYRIYDVIFTEGIGSMFKFAIALLKKNQTTIISLDFEHLLDFLKNGLFEEYKTDDRRFVSDACELEIPSKRLSQLEKEHKLQTQKEMADASLINELQKTNLELKKKMKILETKTNTLKIEHNDVNTQLKETLNELGTLQEEGLSLRTLVSTLETAVHTLPAKIEAQSSEQFEGLCSESAALIGKSSVLEDELQKAEAELIDIKIRYAQTENEKEELHKRLYELKKLMSF